MFFCAWVKRLLCRRLLTFLCVSYFLMILLFLSKLDTGTESKTEDSFSLIFPDSQNTIKRPCNTSSCGLRKHNLAERSQAQSLPNDDLSVESMFSPIGNIETKTAFDDPIPLMEPTLDTKFRNKTSGDFISIGQDAYVFSAFLDDRKQKSFIRIMSLVSQTAAKNLIYCYFNNTSSDLLRISEVYQLCENHNKIFGGYFYSCEIPDSIKIEQLKSIVISFKETGPKVEMPLRHLRPPEHKTAYLDLYPQGSNVKDNIKLQNDNIKSKNVPLLQNNVKNFLELSGESPSNRSLSFAICVSPLYGNISVHRLVEFIELSRILGAQHLVFYNHSAPPQISDALEYLVNKKIVSVIQWHLPAKVDSVWYYGQLLANNDCLYRTMPYFDLVAFNDIDEFIVPHSNATTWTDAFSSLLTPDRCGFSFQSAFYDPSMREEFESTLLTPVLSSKTEMFSKVRTKVMLCPWRVFEVGIHHISKQNKEDWISYGVPPSMAYLHHYRRCVSNYGMKCSLWEKDMTIADRYLTKLTVNYERTLNNILSTQKQRKVS